MCINLSFKWRHVSFELEHLNYVVPSGGHTQKEVRSYSPPPPPKKIFNLQVVHTLTIQYKNSSITTKVTRLHSHADKESTTERFHVQHACHDSGVSVTHLLTSGER